MFLKSSIILILSLPHLNALDFTPQKHKNGLIFTSLSKARISYDSYTLLYHFDLTGFLQIIDMVAKYNNATKFSCKSIHSIPCDILTNQIEVQIEHMIRDEMDIGAYQQEVVMKKKRSLEFVGDLAHWAFGIMNADSARKYDLKINELQNETSRIHNIQSEQLVLIKESIKVNNKSVSQMQDQIRKLNETVETYFYWNQLHHDFVYTETVIHQTVAIAKLLIMEHQRIAHQIIKSLESAVIGKISQLIPIEKLSADLFLLFASLKDNQKLPINYGREDPLHIFKYSKITATLYGKRLLIEVTVPIAEREVYTVYKINPIPTTIGNHTVIIKPSTQYLLINDMGNEYIPISSMEFSNGKFNIEGEKILNPAENVHLDYSEQCEINIFMNPHKEIIEELCDIRIIPTSNYFVPINFDNTFYLTINNPITISEHCRGHASKLQSISQDGILRLEPNCRVNTEKLSIRPRNNYKLENKEIIVLTNNTDITTMNVFMEKLYLLKNYSIPRVKRNILIQNENDFNQLIEQADKLIEKSKTKKQFDQIHYDSEENKTKYFLIILITVFVVFIIIAIIVWYFYNQFFKLNTWIKLADNLAREDPTKIPKLFVQSSV